MGQARDEIGALFVRVCHRGKPEVRWQTCFYAHPIGAAVLRNEHPGMALLEQHLRVHAVHFEVVGTIRNLRRFGGEIEVDSGVAWRPALDRKSVV